jgi:hypothetical protein
VPGPSEVCVVLFGMEVFPTNHPDVSGSLHSRCDGAICSLAIDRLLLQCAAVSNQQCKI